MERIEYLCVAELYIIEWQNISRLDAQISVPQGLISDGSKSGDVEYNFGYD